jgi:hypothetical protein
MEPGTPHAAAVRAQNFKANILCTNHNSALHPADDAALGFAKFLRRIALDYDAGAGDWGDAEEITISGDDMQRWVLKLFLNHAVTGHEDADPPLGRYHGQRGRELLSQPPNPSAEPDQHIRATSRVSRMNAVNVDQPIDARLIDDLVQSAHT